MITIKEVYDQLPKEDLGTERAQILIPVKSSYGVCTIVGSQGETIVFKIGNSGAPDVFDGYFGHIEVEWIGNKPKTKKLYACLMKINPRSDTHFIAYRPKDSTETNGCFLKWLPEDQYPTIEVEVGE